MENNWNDIPFQVKRDNTRKENFYFIHKETLYIGLNIVGGSVHDSNEWETRLSYQFVWTKNLIDSIVVTDKNALTVVIFGHAIPRDKHASFFLPLQEYVKRQLKEKVPMIYIHGDMHYYSFNEKFMGTNFPSIMVEGGHKQPPLQFTVNMPENVNAGAKLKAKEIFAHDRLL